MTDPEKLASCFEAHAAPLVLYARQWLERGHAEDVVQEAFVRLMAQRPEPSNVKAWLHTIVRNAAIDAARSARRRERREEKVAAQAPTWFETSPADSVDADAVQHAVRSLPQRQREIVLLRVWSGMTLTEVSHVMGMAVSTVQDEYRRGLEAVRRLMENPCATKCPSTEI